MRKLKCPIITESRGIAFPLHCRCPMATFTDALHNAKWLVHDGAMATELQARGVALHRTLWSAAVVKTEPDQVKAVHLAYLSTPANATRQLLHLIIYCMNIYYILCGRRRLERMPSYRRTPVPPLVD